MIVFYTFNSNVGLQPIWALERAKNGMVLAWQGIGGKHDKMSLGVLLQPLHILPHLLQPNIFYKSFGDIRPVLSTSYHFKVLWLTKYIIKV